LILLHVVTLSLGIAYKFSLTYVVCTVKSYMHVKSLCALFMYNGYYMLCPWAIIFSIYTSPISTVAQSQHVSQQ